MRLWCESVVIFVSLIVASARVSAVFLPGGRGRGTADDSTRSPSSLFATSGLEPDGGLG